MSIRWDVQTALRTHMATEIIPANGYTFDLSPLGVVSNGIESPQKRQSTMQGDASVQIQEGREDFEMPNISPDTLRQSTFEIVLSCLVRGEATDTPLRQRVNDFLADIHLGIGKNPTVTGVVDRAWIARVDEPTYDPEKQLSGIVVRVLVQSNHLAGTTI